MEAAEASKEAGNKLFRSSDFSGALGHYAEGLRLLDTAGLTAGEAACRQLLIALHGNRAACFLAMHDAAASLACADAVLALDEAHFKSLSRRGEALFLLARFAEAEAAIGSALRNAPAGYDTAALRARAAQSCQGASGVWPIYVRQLAAGRDFAKNPKTPRESLIFPYAAQFQNFVYLVGDPVSRECVVVDACWDTAQIFAAAAADGMKITAAALTHHHFDHTGGRPPPPFDAMSLTVDGISDVLAALPAAKVYVGAGDAAVLESVNGVPRERMVSTADGDTLNVGSVQLKFISTPGHTPGSQCLFFPAQKVVLTGDTLFIGSCGRTDLEGGCSRTMHSTLQTKLATLPADTTVYPGHAYGGASTTIARESSHGVLRPRSVEEWVRSNGR